MERGGDELEMKEIKHSTNKQIRYEMGHKDISRIIEIAQQENAI